MCAFRLVLATFVAFEKTFKVFDEREWLLFKILSTAETNGIEAAINKPNWVEEFSNLPVIVLPYSFFLIEVIKL